MGRSVEVVGVVIAVAALVGVSAAVEGASRCPTCRAPLFSWDTMPVFFHGSTHDTTAAGAFPQESLEQLVRYPAITIEKWQGDQAPGGFLWEEDAWIASAKAIKAIRPNISVFVWLDSIRIYTANKTLNPDAKAACGTGHFRPAEFLETHEDYLLHVQKTGVRAYDPWSGCNIYDFNKDYVRQYWTDMCLNLTSSGVIDGCGADASWQTNPASGQLSTAGAAAWDAAHREMMRDTTTALGNGVLLGKEPNELGSHVNGILDEGCANSEANILGLQNATAVAKRLGKPLVYECHVKKCSPNTKGSDHCLDNAAAFLIGAGENHYFGLGGWTQSGSDFSSHWLPGLFGRPLGEPLQDGMKDPTTGIWSRSFGKGVNVTFNPKTNAGTIDFP